VITELQILLLELLELVVLQMVQNQNRGLEDQFRQMKVGQLNNLPEEVKVVGVWAALQEEEEHNDTIL
jgi:hypothetical protein